MNTALTTKADLERRIGESLTLVAQSRRLRERERSIWSELAPLGTGADRPGATAELIKNLDRLARDLDVEIDSMTVSPEVAPVKRPSPTRLLASSLTLSVRGRFAAIVRFFQEISRQRPLADVSMPRIAASQPARPRAVVSSTIQLTVYRLVLRPADVPR